MRFVIPLTTLQFCNVLVEDVSASMEVSTFPESESLVSNQAIHTLDRSEQESASCLESFDSVFPSIYYIITHFLLSLLHQPFTFVEY